jgi:hypothetical protein
VSAAPSTALVAALKDAIAFEPAGDPAGNVTVGSGMLEQRPIHAALVENRVASGSIGARESEKLGALFTIAAAEKSGLVLFLDSAGAKVSEGLAALGTFRELYRAGLDAAFSGACIAAVLGRNCFGGSSMLAHLAPQRLFSPDTQLAMSGPSILAAASGMSAIDEVFRAMAEASISPVSRAKASGANAVWDSSMDLGAWLREALAPRATVAAASQARHEALQLRITNAQERAWEPVRRRDLERMYTSCDVRESDGILAGHGERDGAAESIVGIVGKTPLGAARAWKFSQAVWRLGEAPPARLEVLLDCATHAGRLDDEKIVLSEFIVDMAFALRALAARGTRVGLTVLGKAGGGVYVALAAPARRVTAVHGADIQVLPGSAVAAILGESRESAPDFAEYRKARVADEEVKLGIVPGMK